MAMARDLPAAAFIRIARRTETVIPISARCIVWNADSTGYRMAIDDLDEPRGPYRR